MIPGVLSDIGGFGGLFALDLSEFNNPVLVSGTDGVGTKLKLAFLLDKHDTVGIDCVAMCVNDIICSGAKPLFFLDYIACGKNVPEKIASIVSGVADGCVQSGMALIGGETAEMPGFYPVDEYDLAGFAVGAVNKESIIDNKTMKSGDIIIGLPSSGVHSNGFSLVRKVFGIDLPDAMERLSSDYGILEKPLGEVLLTPTKIYVKAIDELKKHVKVKAICHITGGGFYENIPRMLPEYTAARIEKGTWPVPAIFGLLQKEGGISEHGMFNTFNMGIGMMIAVSPEEADEAIRALEKAGQAAYRIGVIEENIDKDPEVRL